MRRPSVPRPCSAVSGVGRVISGRDRAGRAGGAGRALAHARIGRADVGRGDWHHAELSDDCGWTKGCTHQRTDPCVDRVCFSSPSQPAAWNAQFGLGQLNLSNNNVASICPHSSAPALTPFERETHHFRTLEHDPEFRVAEFIGFEVERSG
jgi:hypothetical protein